MKLGLDIHGVLDRYPQMFAELAKAYSWAQVDGEVHIITGASITDALIERLLAFNHGVQYWTHIVSIQDELLKKEKPLGYNDKGRPVFDDELWDSFKGRYCEEHDIDLMIDDTERYGKYFTTTKFILFR